MEYRTLGSSGLQVSVVGLGCNNFGRRVDEAGTRAVVEAAIDQGITLLDTAEMYGPDGLSEEFLGNHDMPSSISLICGVNGPFQIARGL